MNVDTRQFQVTPSDTGGQIRAIGLRLVPPSTVVLAAALLAVSLTPGEVAIGHDVTQHRGSVQIVNEGGTLSDGSEIHAAVIAYHNPATHRNVIAVVERDEEDAGDGVPITDAEIEAAIPAASASGKLYTVLGAAKFSRSGSNITLTIDHVARSYGVDPTIKATTAGSEDPLPSEASWYDGHFAPGPVLEVTVDATAFANADLITDYPVGFYGRIARIVRITEVTIAGAGAVMDVGVEADGDVVAGLSVASTLADAKGSVATDVSAAPTYVRPGSLVSLVGSGATAGSGGRARFRLEFEHLVG